MQMFLLPLIFSLILERDWEKTDLKIVVHEQRCIFYLHFIMYWKGVITFMEQ
jgi:hypothetical protein